MNKLMAKQRAKKGRLKSFDRSIYVTQPKIKKRKGVYR